MFTQKTRVFWLAGLMLVAVGSHAEAPTLTRILQVPIEVTGLSVAPLAPAPLFTLLNASCDFDPREKQVPSLFRITLYVTYRDNNTNGVPDNGDEVLEVQPKKGVATFRISKVFFPYACTLNP